MMRACVGKICEGVEGEKRVPKKVLHHKLYLAIRWAFFGMVIRDPFKGCW